MLFKTTLFCEHCVATLSPFLNQELSIDTWEIDLKGEEKLLKVEGDISPEKIQDLLKEAGFQAELIQN